MAVDRRFEAAGGRSFCAGARPWGAFACLTLAACGNPADLGSASHGGSSGGVGDTAASGAPAVAGVSGSAGVAGGASGGSGSTVGQGGTGGIGGETSGTGGALGGGTPNSGGAGAGGAAGGPGTGGGGRATANAGASGMAGSSAAGTGAGTAGTAGGSGGSAGSSVAGSGPLSPPVPDKGSSLPIASPGGAYQVDGNIPYGPLPRQRLDVIYPKGGGPNATKNLPGVIMFHGGGWIQGDKATMSSFYSRFLAHGFIVCTVEYRVADGTTDGGIAPAAVEDALLAAQWFWDYLDYYHVDRARYIVTGASAGGHLALMVGMAPPEAMFGPTSPKDYKIAAIVNGYGPTDVPDLLQRNVSFAVQWLPANTPNRDELATRLSPVTYARADIPPLITVQGSNDTTVPVAENQKLDQLLKAAGADADLHLVTGAGHGFTTPSTAWPDAEKTMFDFLTEHGIIP